MPSITLKDLPPKLHQALKRRAKSRGRSLNREVLAILASAIEPRKIDPESFLAEAAAHRESLPGSLSKKLLEEASSSGRP